METSKLTAEGIIEKAVRIGAKMSGGELPIEVFPIRIQRIISSLHDCQGYPVDYVAAAILAAIAVGIGNSHLVQVKRNRLESSILIGRPVANKSESTSFSNGSMYPKRTFQTMTFRCLIYFFFTGASSCRCITFPGHLLTSKDGETAPDGHNY